MIDKSIRIKEFSQQIEQFKSEKLYPFFKQVNSSQTNVANFNGKEILMFGSNNYLGLNTHPAIVKAAQEAIQKYGTSCTGSRFMNGTLDIHIELEEELKDFLEQEAVIIFPTGFQVNSGVIPALAGKDDCIFIDELNHASIIDGCKLSYAKRFKYKHNNTKHLSDMMERNAHNYKSNIIITDGIFSMDGDIAHLDRIIQVGKAYNSTVMVDCAHAIGVIGKNGAGTASHFGVQKEVDLIGGTFSKSLASVGGFVAGSKDLITYLSHKSRSYIFSASLPPASTASALAALRIIKSDNSFNERLWENTHYAIQLMKSKGINIGNSESPIIPIHVGDKFKTFKSAMQLFEESNIYVNPVAAPAVKDSESILRFSLTSSHNKQQINYAIEAIAKTLDLLSKEPAIVL